MEEADHRADNPYTALEGYKVYDAPTDVLKYVVVGGHPIPAEAIDVDPAGQRVSVPYDRETVESAPEMEDTSGAFDEIVHAHYEGRV